MSANMTAIARVLLLMLMLSSSFRSNADHVMRTYTEINSLEEARAAGISVQAWSAAAPDDFRVLVCRERADGRPSDLAVLVSAGESSQVAIDVPRNELEGNRYDHVALTISRSMLEGTSVRIGEEPRGEEHALAGLYRVHLGFIDEIPQLKEEVVVESCTE